MSDKEVPLLLGLFRGANLLEECLRAEFNDDGLTPLDVFLLAELGAGAKLAEPGSQTKKGEAQQYSLTMGDLATRTGCILERVSIRVKGLLERRLLLRTEDLQTRRDGRRKAFKLSAGGRRKAAEIIVKLASIEAEVKLHGRIKRNAVAMSPGGWIPGLIHAVEDAQKIAAMRVNSRKLRGSKNLAPSGAAAHPPEAAHTDPPTTI